MRKKTVKKITFASLSVGIFCLVVAVISFCLSLPIAEGEISIPHLQNTVKIYRDDMGKPSITGDSRLDISAAMGFIHAQERFFQMDLFRRSAAGELSELFGSQLIAFDKSRRVHRFRSLAKKILDNLPDYEKNILNAYTQGVNAGLKAFKVYPPDYKLLCMHPKPWLIEDSILVGLGMYFELQYPDAEPCTLRGMIYENVRENLANFLLKFPSRWDIQYFEQNNNEVSFDHISILDELKLQNETLKNCTHYQPKMKGSNQWAQRIADKGSPQASIACDMHLGLSAPNIWYLVSIAYNDQELGKIQASGVTIPGNPCLVIGTNTGFAWGFTNAYLDTSGIVLLEEGKSPSSYMTPEGEEDLLQFEETIKVRGKKSVPFTFTWSRWGPVRDKPLNGWNAAISWNAYAVDSFNLKLLDLEKTSSVLEAFKICQSIRIPVQNCMMADAHGNIGWCFAGKLPEYTFYKPRKSSELNDESEKIQKDISSKNILNPPSGVICTANNRVMPEKVISGCYLNPIRAYQINETLQSAKNNFSLTSKQLQSDNRAIFMDRWYRIMLDYLPEDTQWEAMRAELLAWDGKCCKESRGYCLIRSFREKCHEKILKTFLAPCLNLDPMLNTTVCDFEEPVFEYLRLALIEKNVNGLDDNLIEIYREIFNEHKLCIHKKLPWGHHHQVVLRHPLSFIAQILSPFTDMKSCPIDGDYFVPKVLSENEGASIKMIVTFGSENCSEVSLPSGQSGHFLSKSYRIFHKMWLNDQYMSILPGKAVQTLTAYPAK